MYFAEPLFVIAGGERVEPRPAFPGPGSSTTVPLASPLDHLMHQLFIQEGIAKACLLIIIDWVQTSNDGDPEGFVEISLDQGVKGSLSRVALDNVAEQA